MKDVLTIKFYRGQIRDDDYHDMVIDKYQKIFQQLTDYFKAKNTVVFITYLDTYLPPLDTTPFADVEYTGELSQADKDFCVQQLVAMSGDWFYSRKARTCKEYSTIKLVKFAKISSSDVYLLKKTEINLLGDMPECLCD